MSCTILLSGRSRRTLGTFAACLALAACDQGATDPETHHPLGGTVSGINELGEERPLGAAKVSVTLHGERVAEATSDPRGSWEVILPAEGEYDLEISARGFTGLLLEAVRAQAESVQASLVEPSSAEVEDILLARVDRGCGPDPCLDLVLRTDSASLFPEGGRRRVFQVFVGATGRVSAESHVDAVSVLVTDDDPALTYEGSTAVIDFADLRGLALGHPESEAVRVFGATEVTLLGRGSLAPEQRFDELSPVSATSPIRRPPT